MFIPPIPEPKLNAINGIRFGTMDKIFLEFSKPFWNDDFFGVSMLWNTIDKNELKDTQFDWLLDIIGINVVEYQNRVLCGWTAGKIGRRIELLSEETIKEGFLMLLKKFLPQMDIPEPVNILYTKWHKNPNFRGSYSYDSIETDLMDAKRSDLAAPLYNKHNKPVIQFAGEATHDHYFSTVHGAIESGWREAQRLIDYYNK